MQFHNCFCYILLSYSVTLRCSLGAQTHALFGQQNRNKIFDQLNRNKNFSTILKSTLLKIKISYTLFLYSVLQLPKDLSKHQSMEILN